MSSSLENFEDPPSEKLFRWAESQEILPLTDFAQKKSFSALLLKFYRKSDFLEKIKVQLITNLDVCKDLFNLFSPKDSLFSSWDFRYAWYLGYQYQPCFFLFLVDNKPKALLPLWFEANKDRFTWFGSTWQEDNTFWTLEKKLIPVMTVTCPPNTLLNALRINDLSLVAILNLLPDDPKFVLDLKNIDSLDGFLRGLKKKKRYNLKRDCRRLQAYQVKILFGQFGDLKTLIELSNLRFGEKSSWDEKKKQTFIHLLKGPSKDYQLRMFTFKIGSKIAGVDLNIVYKETYYTLKCGYDVRHFPGIGNYALLTDIEDAIKFGCQKVDFLQTLGGLERHSWKENWFVPLPLYKFQKGQVYK